MRNFTAGIERASRPRRKRITVWSSPCRAMSTPMISAAVGSLNSSRSTACCTRSLSMNCMEPDARELALHPHPHEIDVLAVVVHPGRDLRLVGHRHGARIDLLRLPAMGEAAAGEALAEAAGGARGVAEGQPEELGAGIGQGTLDRLPDAVGDRRSLIEQSEGAAALVVQAGDGLGVVLRPGDGIDAPGAVVAGPRGIEQRSRGVGEPVLVDCEPMPLGELGPGLGAELALGVGGDDAARVAQRRQRPQDDPGDQRRLADAVARCDGLAHSFVGCLVAPIQPSPELLQYLALPRLGTALAGKRRAWPPPREGVHARSPGDRSGSGRWSARGAAAGLQSPS